MNKQKNQGRGRARRDVKREQSWRDVIRAHSESGLSIRVFCKSRGVSEASFYFWRRELRIRDAEASASKRASFVPVKVVDDAPVPSDAGIEITLASGHRVLVRGRVDRSALADVVSVLGAG